MVAVSEISWEEVAAPTFGEPTRAAFRQAVAQVVSTARAKLPAELHGRLEKGMALVLAGDVQLQEGGTALVGSQSDGGTQYALAPGRCPCKGFSTAPQGLCSHRLAVAIARRAQGLVSGEVSEDAEPEPPAPPPVTEGIPAQYVVELHGKSFVLFAGLLALAHQRGLTSLTADWTYNDAGLSLAHATAVFPHGTFTECGDASPDNVTKKVSPHFRRVALTRAKARALRDALNVDMVTLEELAE